MKCKDLAAKWIKEMQEMNFTPEEMTKTIRLARVRFYEMQGKEVVDVHQISTNIHEFIDAIHPSLGDLKSYTSLKAKAMNYISNYNKDENNNK